MSIRNPKNNYEFFKEITKNVLTNYDFRGIIYTVKGSKIPHKKGKNIMSRNELITKIEQLKEWEAILEEAQAEAEALRDSTVPSPFSFFFLFSFSLRSISF